MTVYRRAASSLAAISALFLFVSLIDGENAIEAQAGDRVDNCSAVLQLTPMARVITEVGVQRTFRQVLEHACTTENERRRFGVSITVPIEGVRVPMNLGREVERFSQACSDRSSVDEQEQRRLLVSISPDPDAVDVAVNAWLQCTLGRQGMIRSERSSERVRLGAEVAIPFYYSASPGQPQSILVEATGHGGVRCTSSAVEIPTGARGVASCQLFEAVGRVQLIARNPATLAYLDATTVAVHELCGAEGSRCCDPPAACGAGLACGSGVCSACGSRGAACCEGNTCSALGTECLNATCLSCPSVPPEVRAFHEHVESNRTHDIELFGPCPSGTVRSRAEPLVVSQRPGGRGGHCATNVFAEGPWISPNDPTDCRIRVHVSAKPLPRNRARCDIDVHVRAISSPRDPGCP